MAPGTKYHSVWAPPTPSRAPLLRASWLVFGAFRGQRCFRDAGRALRHTQRPWRKYIDSKPFEARVTMKSAATEGYRSYTNKIDCSKIAGDSQHKPQHAVILNRDFPSAPQLENFTTTLT